MDQDSSEENRLREGAVIAGKYALLHVLGRGGMGLVVAAMHVQLERKVAIKFLLPEHLEKADVVSRFTREARAAAKIQNDHVAHVLDVGVDDGTPYMVMEYLEGEDLKQVLSRRGPLGVDEAVRYVVQACEALAEAHALGIVHRDLKPANLFLASRPNGRSILKVLDFGISKIMNPATETELTLTTRAVGSPSYMSPEQLTASRSLDARADVWALGVVLYELVARRRPFTGDSMPNIVAQILKGNFERLDTIRPDLPPGVVAAVHRCLESEPDRRFPSVTELAVALSPFAPTESISSIEGISRPSLSAGPVVPGGEDSISGYGQTGIASVLTPAVRTSHASNNTRLVAVAALGALTVVAVGALLTLGSTRAQTRRDADPTAAAVAITPPVTPPVPAPAPPVGHTLEAAPPPSPAASTAGPSAPPVAAPVAPRAMTPAAPRNPRPPLPHPATTVGSSTAPVPSAPPPAPSCRFVSYFDALGDKHFKQECP